ncbi:MFS transporter [Candidatus Saccharibacteria bacterium]|nr:MFS transporter [Candidatus Saccharibacteria bacterium]
MTDQQRRLSRRYIIYRFMTDLWFINAVWLYFFRLFITDQQIGILDGITSMIGLLAMIPSGALADKFGRDKIVRLGWILVGGGYLVQAAGSSYTPFFVGQTILIVGLSLAAGADEALFFDKLKFKKQSTHWRKLVTRGTQASLVALLVAVLVGGFMYSIHPRLPFVLTGLAFIGATLLIWSIKDDRPKKSRQKLLPELKDYLHDIRTGFAQFRLPKLWLYVPFILTVQGLFYAVGYGMLRLVLMDRFTFDPLWGSVVIASCIIITMGLLSCMHKNADRLSEKKVLTLIGLSAAAGLLLSIANIGLWGYFVILILYAGDRILEPFMSEILNNRSPENQRATVLSVASFLKSLPYVALAPIIGYLNMHGNLWIFLIIWPILIVASIVLYLLLKKRDSHVDFTD